MANRKVYIGLGSNLGDRQSNIEKTLGKLGDCEAIESVRHSSIIETAPLAAMGQQPAYLNTVAEVVTSINCQGLLFVCKRIEKELGRTQSQRWSPRQIDLDILLDGNVHIDTADLTVPHKQMHLRSFVLAGLCELDALLVHPVIGETVEVLAKRLGGRNHYLNKSVPQLISVAGLIGVGKTTLTQGLADVFDCEQLREPYDENPFLSKVYNGDERLALDSQLYFLTQRVKQLSGTHLKDGCEYISDYVFDKELIYAGCTLDELQLELYNEVYDVFVEKVTRPVLVIYMQDSCENCLDRINTRNRSYEKDISRDFLKSLEKEYDELFSRWDKSPVIRLNIKKFDAMKKSDIKQLTTQIKEYVTTEG